MSTWNHSVVLIVPTANQITAKEISRALDPDVGGYEAYETYLSADGAEPATHCVYETPCQQEFFNNVQFLSNSEIPIATRAGALKQMVDADYVARWPEFTAPTLAECQTFLENVQVFSDAFWDFALQEAGLQVVQNNPI